MLELWRGAGRPAGDPAFRFNVYSETFQVLSLAVSDVLGLVCQSLETSGYSGCIVLPQDVGHS